MSKHRPPYEQRRLEWLRRITGQTTIRGIARSLGRDHTTVGRWVKEGFTLDAVVRISLERDADPYQALDEIGWLEEHDSDGMPALQRVPTERLTAELHRRAVARQF
ncbi:hypothetical protein ABIQ69_11285 [Agromyces sp. G08B096]|uniref:Homeodomain-like domain-containing protein n=1 Tax=Agromyces sp. G08B096 TaxID=3156399 RepID=A0AAU7W606_9MICO